MELVKLGEKTYYIKNNTNIGVYKVSDDEVYIIDTGNDSDAGKKILKICEQQNWKIIGIINTHSHADHIGGNQIIQKRTNAKIYAHGIESDFTNHPILEPMMLFGSTPLKELENKFLKAKSSLVTLSLLELPKGITIIPLPGHTIHSIGVKTSDEVYFLGDAIVGNQTIDKYGIFFLTNVEDYLTTLEQLEQLEGKTFIPSHVDAFANIKPLITKNKEQIQNIANTVYILCKHEISFEALLQQIFTHYHLTMNVTQYFLIGSTLKAYLSYLEKLEKITYVFHDNQMFWKQKES